MFADLRGKLLMDEPMSRHTSWRIGGPADKFYKPADLDDLSLFLSRLDRDEPLFWLGLGSNLLVRDGGIRGTVICTTGVLDGMEMLADGRVQVDAGAACARVARFCARNGMGAAEFLAGIPGTMGGALAMNAGAFGGETWQLVESVETMDRQGRRVVRRPDEFSIAYREVGRPEGEWFVRCWLRLALDEDRQGKERIRELLDRRGRTQPTNQPNAGSVFRNPPGDHAARLIEAAGLKGHCIGKACVSEKHANFIINTGGALAADVESLIALVAAEVECSAGIRLRTEVHIVGEQQR